MTGEINPETRVRIIREEADRLEQEVAGYTHQSPQILAGRAIIQSMREHADQIEREDSREVNADWPPCQHGYDAGMCVPCYPSSHPFFKGDRVIPGPSRQQIEDVMRGWGLSDTPEVNGDGIHAWRCEHPDTYGRCDCFKTSVDEMTALIAGTNG